MEKIDKLKQLFENKSIVEKFEIITQNFSKIAFSTSFQIEDQVITDIIFRNNLPIKIFTLDTGRHFEETYKTHRKTTEYYKKTIIVYFPDFKSVENLVNTKGLFSFYESKENRIECCHIRKVEPLRRALNGVDCWITGLRKQQSANRTNIEELQWDDEHKLVKFNPLIDWSLEHVRKYVDDNNVPYNVLQDNGFASIGCEPCTRAIKQGEDIRAGRWWWENNSSKECGLHSK